MSETQERTGQRTPQPAPASIKDVRDWILLVAATEPHILRDEWFALDEDRAANVIQDIGPSAIPRELLAVVAEDIRPQVQAALHQGGVLEHTEALTVADLLGARHISLGDLRESARRGITALLKGAQGRTLRPEEIRGICGIAREGVHLDTIQAIMFYVQRLPEVARAVLENPLVTGQSPDEAHAVKIRREHKDRAAELEVAKTAILRPLLNSMAKLLKNGGFGSDKTSWGNVLTQAYKLIAGNADLQEFFETVITTARLAPETVMAFIEDGEIDDATIKRQILPIVEVVRPHRDDDSWVSVFRSLRRNRNQLYNGAIGQELTAKIRTKSASDF